MASPGGRRQPQGSRICGGAKSMATKKSTKAEKTVTPLNDQEEKLKAEGHAFESAGHGIFTGIKVAGYKEKLV